jgi:hypothetical protein
MSFRLHCRACRTAFLTHDDPAGRTVTCPKCGATQVAAPQGSTPTGPPTAESVFIPSEATGRRRTARRLAWLALAGLLVAGLAVGTVVAWPRLRQWWNPVPPDPVEQVASAYLKALADGDSEAQRRLGTVELPPAIRTFREVKHDPARDRQTRGSFAPISAFHARLSKTYDYDEASGRYIPKNQLGPAAETLDALHEAKDKAEQDGLYDKMQSGDPEDLFDAAESLAKAYKPLAKLAEGALNPKRLIPSYQQLVETAKPPLPTPEKALALDFAANRETWDALLKRPFTTLRADGPFLLERAEVTASIVDALGSLGDPPRTLRLTLSRFRLEGIDTGWRVTSARRDGEPDPNAPEPDEAVEKSPDEESGSRHVSPGEPPTAPDPKGNANP